jgi:peptidoglycan/xylan/chitin deacetylase (PgdA/CDA1 family)
VILLYHNIVPNIAPDERWCAGQALPLASFERHVRWLAKHFRIVSLDECLEHKRGNGATAPIVVALTFDDGLRSTFRNALPVLDELHAPATFFVTTGHLEHGKLLWFSYLNAVCFEGGYPRMTIDDHVLELQTTEQRRRARRILGELGKASGDPTRFCLELAKIYPLPPNVALLYEGMTHEQLKVAGSSHLFAIGAHTLTHPYLSQKSEDVQRREIFESKEILSKLTGKPVRYFAYPGGDYGRDTLRLVKEAGYEAAFSVIPDQLGIDHLFEIGRVGIYTPSLFKLFLKVFGIADLARRFNLRVG